MNEPTLIRTAVALVSILCAAAGWAQSVGDSRAWLAEQMQPHLSAYIKLNEGYKGALNRLLEAQTQASNLQGAIEVRKEIEVFGEGREFNEAAFKKRVSETLTPLKQLQSTYLIEHARITASLRSPLNRIAADFTQRLEAARNRLTQESNLAEAQRVDAMIEELKRSPGLAINKALAAAEAKELVGLAFLSDDPNLLDSVEANLLLQAKGEIEIYHNTRKIVVRNQSSLKSKFSVKVPARIFKAGDTIVLKAKTPVVYRAIVAALQLPDRSRQIPVKLSDWKFLGEEAEPGKITTDDILAAVEGMAPGAPDPDGAEERLKFGFLPENQGGSDWVKSKEQLNGTYCAGFVITAEMLKR